jgi:hypothetical protein
MKMNNIHQITLLLICIVLVGCVQRRIDWSGVRILGDDGKPVSEVQAKEIKRKAEKQHWSETRILDEDRNVIDFLLPPVKFFDKSDEYKLGWILDYCEKTVKERRIEISVYHRDTRAVALPETKVLRNQDLLQIYRTPDDPRAKGSSRSRILYREKVRLSDMMTDIGIALNYNCHTDGYSNKEVLAFHLGPDEFTGSQVSSSTKRKAYSVPDELRSRFETFPRNLWPVGTCVAYDPATYTLVIIDDGDSFGIVEALGCKCLYESKMVNTF